MQSTFASRAGACASIVFAPSAPITVVVRSPRQASLARSGRHTHQAGSKYDASEVRGCSLRLVAQATIRTTTLASHFMRASVEDLTSRNGVRTARMHTGDARRTALHARSGAPPRTGGGRAGAPGGRRGGARAAGRGGAG